MPEDNLQSNPQSAQPDNPQVIQPTNSSASITPSPSPEPQPIVSSATTQPTGVVNGQAFRPPTPNSQLGQSDSQKPSKWRRFFIILGILQVLGIISFFVM